MDAAELVVGPLAEQVSIALSQEPPSALFPFCFLDHASLRSFLALLPYPSAPRCVRTVQVHRLLKSVDVRRDMKWFVSVWRFLEAALPDDLGLLADTDLPLVITERKGLVPLRLPGVALMKPWQRPQPQLTGALEALGCCMVDARMINEIHHPALSAFLFEPTGAGLLEAITFTSGDSASTAVIPRLQRQKSLGSTLEDISFEGREALRKFIVREIQDGTIDDRFKATLERLSFYEPITSATEGVNRKMIPMKGNKAPLPETELQSLKLAEAMDKVKVKAESIRDAEGVRKALDMLASNVGNLISKSLLASYDRLDDINEQLRDWGGLPPPVVEEAPTSMYSLFSWFPGKVETNPAVIENFDGLVTEINAFVVDARSQGSSASPSSHKKEKQQFVLPAEPMPPALCVHATLHPAQHAGEEKLMKILGVKILSKARILIEHGFKRIGFLPAEERNQFMLNVFSTLRQLCLEEKMFAKALAETAFVPTKPAFGTSKTGQVAGALRAPTSAAWARERVLIDPEGK